MHYLGMQASSESATESSRDAGRLRASKGDPTQNRV